MSPRKAQDNFCPAVGCRSRFRTMDGLHTHIEKKHDGKSVKQLRKEADEAYGGS